MDRSQEEVIGNLISDIENKINLNKQINRNLEALSKQLYDYWFVQFDFPDENGKSYRSSGGKMVWNDKLKCDIPSLWKDLVVNDLADVCMSGNISTR